MANLLSVGGELKPLNHDSDPTEARSVRYEPIGIGKPLVVRYLRFFLRHDAAGDKRNEELMISTHVKTAEQRPGEAEAINYYNPRTAFTAGVLDMVDFGAECYGHELIYYTRSYLGQSVRLTTKVMELDNAQVPLNRIADGIVRVGSLPIFMEFLPYVAIARDAVNLIGRLIKLLDPDDEIVRAHNLDLHYQRNHARLLQSGRIVCVQGRTDADFLGTHRLDDGNHLVRIDTAKPYTDSSYFVLQVNCEDHPEYEGFDHFRGAAELLARTNRPGHDVNHVIDAVAHGVGLISDTQMIRRIEDLRYTGDPAAADKARAYFKALSPEMRKLFAEAFERMFPS